MVRGVAVGLVALVLAAVAVVYLAGRGGFGSHEGPGEPTTASRSAAAVAESDAQVAAAAATVGVARPKQILFGDLHVHTTFSFDAFMLSLSVMGGEGSHPPADACDFARFCSALDFWSINDHAFSITPRHWAETVDSIRQCNDVGGDAANPDLVSFLGWEWTQVGLTPDEHYGHKNVVLRHTDEARIPARPFDAMRSGLGVPSVWARGLAALAGGGRLHDLAAYWSDWSDAAYCEDGVPSRDLPVDCIETAPTPVELFGKLDEWGVDSLVIPHGTTWGFYTPPGSTWDKQLREGFHDPDRQRLIEIYSGHGDSDVWRDFEEVEFGADGELTCPPPSANHLPTCWRAGEIIRERCLAAGESEAECEDRAATARAHAVAAGIAAHRTVPGARVEDWLDAGQCRDCSQPAFNYRPGGSAQYIAALGNFDADSGHPRRFRLGFMASSDNHFARPGTGYKQVFRQGMTESQQVDAAEGGRLAEAFLPPVEAPVAESRPFRVERPGFDVFEVERQTSFFTTGGLVAVHAAGRGRDAIWEALERREVYGTTGQRTLLWFELLNPPGSRGATLAMGSEIAMLDNPIFQVRAVGSHEQQPGCPEAASAALGPERLAHLCKGECHHPSDRRRLVTRIEVVRIRPQAQPGEDVAGLIDDPWRSFSCDPNPEGCVVTFSDPDFPGSRREALYYVRAFEAPQPAINAGNLRCEFDSAGNCVKVNPCPGPAGENDDCLAEAEPRAWSSPIYLDPL